MIFTEQKNARTHSFFIPWQMTAFERLHSLFVRRTTIHEGLTICSHLGFLPARVWSDRSGLPRHDDANYWNVFERKQAEWLWNELIAYELVSQETVQHLIDILNDKHDSRLSARIAMFKEYEEQKENAKLDAFF